MTPRTSLLLHRAWLQHKKRASNADKGIALLMSLMIGMVLLVAATGLLMRQLAARKLGAAESYQQMAEAAASNGFNRIIAVLNNSSTSEYRGHLLTIDNKNPSSDGKDPFEWEHTYAEDEFCHDNTPLPPFLNANGNIGQWPRNASGYPLMYDQEGSMRGDNKGNVQTFYRLRNFSTNFSEGKGTGVFEVEGLVKRMGGVGIGAANTNDPVIARALLTRSLVLESKISDANDWAVMASRSNVANSGSININGPGRYLWDVRLIDSTARNACNPTSMNNVTNQENDEDVVWPVLNRGLPDSEIYNADLTIDQKNNINRVWSFDDRQDANREPGIPCGYNKRSIVCTRTSNYSYYFSNPLSDSAVITEGQNPATAHTIKISSTDICTSKPNSNVCHVYIEHLNLSKTKLFIENDDARPVVLHFEIGDDMNRRSDLDGVYQLSGTSQLCGVDSTSGSSPTCNQQPQQLVITAAMGDDPQTCPSEGGEGFEFSGNSLPAAWISLTRGRVSIKDQAEMRGVIWASSICGSGSASLNLITANDSSEAYVDSANALWGWPEIGFTGYGRRTIRGIRGSGFDIFKRW